MANKSKTKGDKAERAVIKILGGERSFWQPGNSDEEKRGDLISVPYLGQGEVKIRKDGFKEIYKWLTGNDFLAIRADRKQWLGVLPLEDLKQLIDELDELKKTLKAIPSCDRLKIAGTEFEKVDKQKRWREQVNQPSVTR